MFQCTQPKLQARAGAHRARDYDHTRGRTFLLSSLAICVLPRGSQARHVHVFHCLFQRLLPKLHQTLWNSLLFISEQTSTLQCRCSCLFLKEGFLITLQRLSVTTNRIGCPSATNWKLSIFGAYSENSEDLNSDQLVVLFTFAVIGHSNNLSYGFMTLD